VRFSACAQEIKTNDVERVNLRLEVAITEIKRDPIGTQKHQVIATTRNEFCGARRLPSIDFKVQRNSAIKTGMIFRCRDNTNVAWCLTTSQRFSDGGPIWECDPNHCVREQFL